MNPKPKILITSVGSLVGQNILDVLEHAPFRRRDLVEVVGTNSLAKSPNNFRCDRCYLVQNTDTGAFRDEMTAILRKEQPDLILSGRDEDTFCVAELVSTLADVTARLPCGTPSSLRIALDKWETWCFCQRHGLPFASTFALGPSGGIDALERFASEHGFPLIAKPVQGFASKGVFFLRDFDDARAAAQLPHYILQEYLGNSRDLEPYLEQMARFTPLFASAPGVFHHSCHAIIDPHGSVDDVFISRNDHENGVTMGFRRVCDEELDALTRRYAAALHAEGGYGPMTIQFRRDRAGIWKVQEMNLRTNGNTFPRFLMGQDDLGQIFRGVLPELEFPIHRPPPEAGEYLIGKSLRCAVMVNPEIDALQMEKMWDAASSNRAVAAPI